MPGKSAARAYSQLFLCQFLLETRSGWLDWNSLCSTGWSRTLYVAPGWLKTHDLPASPVLELQQCTVPGCMPPSHRRATDPHRPLRNSAFTVVMSRELVRRGDGKEERGSWLPPMAGADAVRSWDPHQNHSG